MTAESTAAEADARSNCEKRISCPEVFGALGEEQRGLLTLESLTAPSKLTAFTYGVW
jgi:hypothetical protein